MAKLFLAVSVLAFGAIVASQSQAAVWSGGTNMPQGADHGTRMLCKFCETDRAPDGHYPDGYYPGGHGPALLNPQPLPPGIVADGRMLRR
jgi:hypothetical protein